MQGRPIPTDPFDEDRTGRVVFFDHEDELILGHADRVYGLSTDSDGFRVVGPSTTLMSWLEARWNNHGEKWTFMIRNRDRAWYRVDGAWMRRYAPVDPGSFDWVVDNVVRAEEPLF